MSFMIIFRETLTMILLYHDNVYSERKKTLTPLLELNGTDLFQIESKSSKDALCLV